MKKIMLILTLACGLLTVDCSSAQDTLNLLNFKLTVRMAALIENSIDPNSDLYYSLRTAYKNVANATLSDSITVDTITVNDYVRLYALSFTMSNHIGSVLQKVMFDHVVYKRTINGFLNRLMTAQETLYATEFNIYRDSGVLRLRRKNN